MVVQNSIQAMKAKQEADALGIGLLDETSTVTVEGKNILVTPLSGVNKMFGVTVALVECDGKAAIYDPTQVVDGKSEVGDLGIFGLEGRQLTPLWDEEDNFWVSIY